MSTKLFPVYFEVTDISTLKKENEEINAIYICCVLFIALLLKMIKTSDLKLS